MPRPVALNVDLGELPDEPEELYALATIVNVACGGHAGDAVSMVRAVALARASGARVAAHPSYPDRVRFGRVSVGMPLDRLRDEVARQCDALVRAGADVVAVKPHGALYHDTKDPAIARAVLDGVAAALGTAVSIVGAPRSALREEAALRGHPYVREGFADRGYREDGALVPRTEPGALIEDPAAAAAQALALARSGDVDTLCVHGDTPGAVAVARAVRDALELADLLDRARRTVRIATYGERAVLVPVDASGPKERARRAHAAATQLAARHPSADVVLGAGCVAVVGTEPRAAVAALGDAPLGEALAPSEASRTHVVRAVYDGPDLAEIAARLGVAEPDVVALHASVEYEVELVGFLPGFAYLVGLDERLVLPRRASPRARVPAGSVGIAGPFTGVYPSISPGGWNLLARAVGFSPFDPMREPPILLRPGDRVRFEPVHARDAAPIEAAGTARGEPVQAISPERALVVVAVGVGATIQDAGRPGRLAQGISPSGPLDVEAHRAANLAVGNDAGAAAIELAAGGAIFEARGALVVSVDGEPAVGLADGERLVVAASTRAVRYVAVAGGIDVPVVLGARATLVPAKLGGLGGRMLRPRDVLPVGDDAGSAIAAALPPDPPPEPRLAIAPGPHVERFPARALEALLSSRFTVSRLADRVGVRLEGARVPREGGDTGLPVPMLRGAIQVATDGTPIVLGPDHPTTGGYPVLAVVRAEAQPVLARLRAGAPVRFVLD